MKTNEQKAVEEAANEQVPMDASAFFHFSDSDIWRQGFIKGAQFLSNLRKPSEELIQTNDVIKMLESIKKDANNLHSGNVAHQKVHIIGGINYLMEEIAKLLQPDVNAELLGALKAIRQICDGNKDVENNIWHTCNKAISNYEKQQ